MKKFLAAAAILAAVPAIASAQETAPDGTDAFGVEPYVGVLGGYHTFDRGSELGAIPGETFMNGALISGIAGVNVRSVPFLSAWKATPPRALATSTGNMVSRVASALVLAKAA